MIFEICFILPNANNTCEYRKRSQRFLEKKTLNYELLKSYGYDRNRIFLAECSLSQVLHTFLCWQEDSLSGQTDKYVNNPFIAYL